MKIASRLADIAPSPTLAVMQEAQRRRAQGIDIIDLGPGEPDFPTPGPVKEAAEQAIRDNFTKYTAAAGMRELRQAVADRWNRDWGCRFTTEHVTITAGAKSAIFNIVMTMFDAGQEVLIPAPYWVTFPEAVRISGALPRSFPTRECNGFALKAADFESHVTSRTAGLIINSPNNPSGAVIAPGDLADIVALCRSRRILLISDETYDRFTFDGRTHASAASCVSAEDDFCALAGSFSKTYSMTGWRLGYLISHPDHIRAVNNLQSHTSGNACSISQKAGLAALSSASASVDEMLAEYARRREYVVPALNALPGFSCPIPYGAFYAFPNVSECMKRLDIPDSATFSRFLLDEARVATVAGSDFGLEGYIRISYATSMENLRRGVERIEKAVG